MEEDFLAKCGIQMGMHAGDARVSIRRSLDMAQQYHFAEAREAMKLANEELIKGHEVQTEILQKECEGDAQGYNVLFAHGMDTLMTVKSEYELAEKIVEMYEAIDMRIKKLEG